MVATSRTICDSSTSLPIPAACSAFILLAVGEVGHVRCNPIRRKRTPSGAEVFWKRQSLQSRIVLKTRLIEFLTAITYCNSIITYCDMTLGEKLRYLREVEGTLRGMSRDLSQQEVSRLIQKEQGKS